MQVHPWFWVWAALAAILFVAEVLTSDFYMFPFGAGAAAAALLEFLGVSIGWQWIAFLGLSSALTVGLRRYIDRPSRRAP